MKKVILVAILILALVLRVPGLDRFPAGLNADEAAIGYNAYSLIQTGRDEHGAVWPLVFRSFDDYKPPIYFYLVLPFVYFLGPTEFAVRLPSALLGAVSVLFIYLLTNQLFAKSIKTEITPGHLAALLLSVSPWHLHFSRGGWEANAASTFMLIGLYFLMRSLKNTKYFLLTTIFFVLSLYTYHSLRVVVPLVFLSFLTIYYSKIKAILAPPENLRPILLSLVLGLLLLSPLGLQFMSQEGRSRFSGVSVFADEGPLWEALELRREDDGSLLAKVLHNRYSGYAYRFAKNYLYHFSPRFLFVVGDEIGRSKVPGMGQAYLISLPFFLLGVLFLLEKPKSGSKLVLSWLLISPLAAALTFQSPHALRAQNMVYPLTIITAIGLYKLAAFISARQKTAHITAIIVLFLLFGYEVARYLHQYYIHYPKEIAYAWQYGFQQIAAYTKEHETEYDKIIISDRYDQPYILMAFFLRYPPEKLQKEIVLTPRDKFGFSTVRQFGKYEFRHIDYGQDEKIKNALIIAADEPVNEARVIFTINDPGGKIMWRFVKP